MPPYFPWRERLCDAERGSRHVLAANDPSRSSHRSLASRLRELHKPKQKHSTMSERAPDERDLPSAVAEALCTVAEKLRPFGTTWSVGGSLGRWLRGFDAIPHDIDLDTGAEYAEQITDALKEYQIEPASAPSPQAFPSLIGAYEISGVPVELYVDCEIRFNDLHYVGRFSRYWGRVQLFPFRGRRVPVLPLEESLLVNVVLGRWEKLAEITSSATFARHFDVEYFRQRATEIGLPAPLLERFVTLASRS